MKILVSLVLVTALSGCAVVEKVTDLWPREHDPAMASAFINLQRSVTQASCGDRVTIQEAAFVADWLLDYTMFRNDPQKDAVKSVRENLTKAASSSKAACTRWMNIVNIKMKIIKDSWSQR